MMLLTKKDRTALLANGKASAVAIARDGNTPDHKPVVKFFNPMGAATWWLFSELGEDGDTLFGLCDLGFGEPELGYASLLEIQGVKLRWGVLGIERDRYFTPDKTLSQYAKEAREKGRIVA